MDGNSSRHLSAIFLLLLFDVLTFAIWGTSLGQHSKYEAHDSFGMEGKWPGRSTWQVRKDKAWGAPFMPPSLSPVMHTQSAGTFSWLCLQNSQRGTVSPTLLTLPFWLSRILSGLDYCTCLLMGLLSQLSLLCKRSLFRCRWEYVTLLNSLQQLPTSLRAISAPDHLPSCSLSTWALMFLSQPQQHSHPEACVR